MPYEHNILKLKNIWHVLSAWLFHVLNLELGTLNLDPIVSGGALVNLLNFKRLIFMAFYNNNHREVVTRLKIA
jgi:hypothetical protein